MKVAKSKTCNSIYTEVDAIMYDNGKIYLGLSGEERVELPLSMCNRHGLIAGATGSASTFIVTVLPVRPAPARPLR